MKYRDYKKKLVILQAIGIIVIKSKEIRVVTYICRYSSGHLVQLVHIVSKEWFNQPLELLWLVKGKSWSEATLNSEEIKQAAIAIIELRLSEGISK